MELSELTDYKDSNDVKNSKSCPAIYKISKQRDGTTLHELLTEDLKKGLRLNAPTNVEEQESETPLHHKPIKEDKLNIILDENGKSTLFNAIATKDTRPSETPETAAAAIATTRFVNNTAASNMLEKPSSTNTQQLTGAPLNIAYDSLSSGIGSSINADDHSESQTNSSSSSASSGSVSAVSSSYHLPTLSSSSSSGNTPSSPC